MNKVNLGCFSIIFAGISCFVLLMMKLENQIRLDMANTLFALLTFSIILGVISFIIRSQGRIIAIIGILLSFLCLIPVCNEKFFPEKAGAHFKPGYTEVSFLGNSSNSIGLHYCNFYKNCFIKYKYDISSQEYSRQEDNNTLDNYVFSRDGGKALFIDGSEDVKNVFIMNIDGSEKKQLTHSSEKSLVTITDGYGTKRLKMESNSSPSFSPDGKQVIFVRHTSKIKYRSGSSNLYDCDIYEVNIDTGKERKLTNFNFEDVYCPQYFSDGTHFIFSAKTQMVKDAKEYGDIYKHSGIFILDNQAAKDIFELKADIVHSSFFSRPSISFDDKIVYTNEMVDTGNNISEIFIKTDDEIKRLTHMKSNIGLARISADGKRVVFNESRWIEKDRYYEKHFWIINSDGTDLRELISPKD